MSEPNIKQVTLTGGAAAELTGGKKERKKRSTGGSTVQPSSPAASSSSPASAPAPAPASALPLTPLTHSSRIPLPPSTPIPSRILPQIRGGVMNVPLSSTPVEQNNKVIKVELKKNNQTKRVQLQPKKGANAPFKGGKKAQTKKSRKVTLGVVALHKRMLRAKKMTRKVKEMSIQQLREHLIQKKLIKSTSKAPEFVLRQIAADAQIVAGKAL